MAFCIRVVDPDGNVMYVRNGPVPGRGSVAQFQTREEARKQIAFFKQGMTKGEDYESMEVIPFRDDMPKEDVGA